MLPQYKLVLINLIISGLLIAGLTSYRYFYPKRKINLLFLLIIISFLPLISILRVGTYESGDLSLHSKITMPFYQSLSEGNIIPRWASDMCGGYGCPNYIFMYMLPYYIISGIHFLGFSFIDSIKILLAIAFIASGVCMYFWAKEELGKNGAFVSSVFFLFSPYHLVNTHFRVDIAESTAYVFLPLNFLATKKVIESNSKKWILIQVISLAFLILSHQAVALGFFPFIIAYGIFVWKRKRISIVKLFNYFIVIFLGILVVTFYWIPILVEKQYIAWGYIAGVVFPQMYEFFYSPWRYGLLFQGPIGQLSFIIGYIQWIIVLISLFAFKKINKKYKGLLFFSLTSFFICFLLMQSFSKYFWEIVPLVKNFQFVYRLLNLTAFFSSIIAGVIIVFINRKWFLVFICSVTIFSTILNWGNRRTIPEINDNYLKAEMLREERSLGDFTLPIWVDTKTRNYIDSRKGSIEIIEGQAEISEKKRLSTLHEYTIDAKTTTIIKENTFYFPGWKLLVDNKLHTISYENVSYPGTINFTLPKGVHNVQLSFSPTLIHIITQYISVISFSTLIIFLLLKKTQR